MKCVFCVEEKDVDEVTDVFAGDHLKIGRVGIGERFMYWHHCVVIDVEHATKKITVIHHTKKNKKFAVLKEEIFFSKLKGSKLRRLVYNVQDKDQHVEEIINRANEQLQKYGNHEEKDSRYDLLLNNCEHLAIYCVTGIKYMSVQWDKLMNNGNILMVIIHKIARVLSNMDKFLKHSLQFMDKTMGWGIDVAAFVMSIVVAIIDLINLYLLKKRNVICNHCYKSRRLKICASLLLTFAVTGIFYGVVFTTPLGSIIPLAIALFLTSTVISLALYKFWKPLSRWIYSDAKYDKIKDLRKISPGDIIMYKYLPFVKHHAVVIECSPLFPCETDILYYNLQKRKLCDCKIQIREKYRRSLSSDGLNRLIMQHWLQKSQKSLDEKNSIEQVTDVGYLLHRFINRKTFYAGNAFRDMGADMNKKTMTKILQRNAIIGINENTERSKLLEIAREYKDIASNVRFCCNHEENIIHVLSRSRINKILEQNGLELVDDLHKAKETVIHNQRHSLNIEKEVENLNEEIRKLEENKFENAASNSDIFEFLEKHGICYRSNRNEQELSKLISSLKQEEEQTVVKPQTHHLQKGSVISIKLKSQGWTTAFVNSEHPIKEGVLKVIHYMWGDSKLTRVITKESRRFNLRRLKSLYVQNFESFKYTDVWEANDVVSNATEKLGEGGWSLNERSEHFAGRCKLKPTAECFRFMEVDSTKEDISQN